MRFRDILLEYDRSKTIASYWDKLWPVLRKDDYALNQLDDFENSHPSRNVEYPETEEYQAVVMPWFENADPTPNKSVVRWIVAMYVNGKINSVEDFFRVRTVISKIEILKKNGYFRRHPEKAKLGDYSKLWPLNSLEMFISLVDPKEYESEAERSRRLASDMAGEEQADIILNSDRYKVVSPKTAAAASFYGKNTKWCTTSENGGMFNYYNKRGPLFIILDKPNNRRWQFHFETDQFMDEMDEGINPYAFAIDHPEAMISMQPYMPPEDAIAFGIGIPGMTVENLDFSYVLSDLYLPNDLTVMENLTLSGCTNLQSLPDGLTVGGYIDARGCASLTRIGVNLFSKKMAFFSGCSSLRELPSGFEIQGDLMISDTGIAHLPRDIKVSGDVFALGCPASILDDKPEGVIGSIRHGK